MVHSCWAIGLLRRLSGVETIGIIQSSQTLNSYLIAKRSRSKVAERTYEFVAHTSEVQVTKYKEDAKFFLALRVSVKRRYFDDLEYKEYEPQVQKLIDKHITTEGEVLRITELVDIFNKEQREQEVEKLTSKAARADHIASRTARAIDVKMDEDPVYYKKLSRLIRDTIDDYHHQRITEAEYLKKAMAFEDQFLNGQQQHVPDCLKGNATAIAIYNLTNEIFGEILPEGSLPAVIAGQIDNIIRSNVLENGKAIIDWQSKSDIEGRVRIEIDDYLFDLQGKQNLELPLDLIDDFVEESLKVARLKYV